MGQSIKAILQLVLVVLVLVSVVVWGAPRHPDATVWAWRFGGPAGVALLGVVLVRSTRRREVLPDLLARAAGGRYFERDGLCFAFSLVADGDGRPWMRVFFQNRYERPCAARIVLKPPQRTLGIGRWPMATIAVTVDCDGAAFGVHRTPWPVPAKLQGRSARCDVAAKARYPNGRGKLMRYREGIRAGVPGSDVGRAALMLGAAAVGSLYLSEPAHWRVRLPTGLPEFDPTGETATTEILWRPDLPTGGFPIEPTTQSRIGEGMTTA